MLIAMEALLDVILPVFLVIAFGYVAVLRNFLDAPAIDGLMKFSQNFAIPLLLFRAISTLDLEAGFDPALLGSYYTGSFSVFMIGMFGAVYLFKRSWEDSVSVGFSALFANSVLLGLAIMERAYGRDALAPNYAIVAIHAPFCYFLGISPMEVVKTSGGAFSVTAFRVVRAMFSNNLMIAIGLGFVVNLSGISMPVALSGAFDLVIRAALPTALFALGGTLTRYRPEGDMKVVIWICALSLFLHPSIAYLMGTAVFDLSEAQLKGAVLTAAMAPGVNSYLFASIYGAAMRIAATAVLTGTLFSILSVAIWLTILGV